MRGLRIIKFILLNVFVFIFVLEASDIYESQDGWRMSPRGEYRFLTIMVNVIYPDSDKTGENLDPRPEANGIWDPATKEGINNQSIPTYLKDFLDVEYDPDNVNGVMTRLYHESSFGELVILGDFIVVNINKSRITPNDVKEEFHISNARNYIIDFINNNGGGSESSGKGELTCHLKRAALALAGEGGRKRLIRRVTYRKHLHFSKIGVVGLRESHQSIAWIKQRKRCRDLIT